MPPEYWTGPQALRWTPTHAEGLRSQEYDHRGSQLPRKPKDSITPIRAMHYVRTQHTVASRGGAKLVKAIEWGLNKQGHP